MSYPIHNKKIIATFLKRKNRFVVIASVDGKIKECYLPNSGRLWELLIPNKTELMLIENSQNQKLKFTVLACKKEHHWVLLHTHLTNKIVKSLINQEKLPFYRGFRVVSEEVKIKNSRVDLLLENSREKNYLEVKTCTLFGKKTAMFPDAVTERGKRHLIELKDLVQKNIKASVLFVVMNPEVEFFLPAYHIDYEFSKTFMLVKDIVDIKAISLKWDSSFTTVEATAELKIDFSFLERVLNEKGVYLLVMHLQNSEKIIIGNLGKLNFTKGYYVYIGKSKRGLFKRIARHRRKLKKMHWHIDYFLTRAKLIRDLPILTEEDIECQVAYSLSKISDKIIPEFGSSDCNCNGHLFYFKENPLFNLNFIEMINHYRMDILDFS
ncbi:MAG: DNA/RNA nuclease SfsA [Thermodesulfovibrio sp.]|nr:DNA/RNA nuclease SfsA [Thermodesulfovibrio sp.]MDW7998095.1 DNA/RNA nuclease SfsA [Thermodesulfovibrio sp.]